LLTDNCGVAMNTDLILQRKQLSYCQIMKVYETTVAVVSVKVIGVQWIHILEAK